jgi:hypothetical protein
MTGAQLRAYASSQTMKIVPRTIPSAVPRMKSMMIKLAWPRQTQLSPPRKVLNHARKFVTLSRRAETIRSPMEAIANSRTPIPYASVRYLFIILLSSHFLGLYYLGEDSYESICFQPNDEECPETDPVSCPEAEISKMVGASASEPTKKQQVKCQELCDGLPACRDDPDAHGSFCKTWGIPSPVCFGMYYTSESMDTLCFQPNDPSCPDKYPVSCAV